MAYEAPDRPQFLHVITTAFTSASRGTQDFTQNSHTSSTNSRNVAYTTTQ